MVIATPTRVKTIALLVMALASGCHDHPCTPDQAKLDTGDPIDGYCAAVDVIAPGDVDEVAAILAAGGTGNDQPIATPGHPERPAHFAVFELQYTSSVGSTTVEAWSPYIDAGWTDAAVVGLALRAGVVVATGRSRLAEVYPDGDPSYAAANVDAIAPPSPDIELWGAASSFGGTSPCARVVEPDGSVDFIVAANDFDCDGIANAQDASPNSYGP
jgi:hypothetical protein